MNGVVRFQRTHNRTVQDVFNNMILPKLPLALNDICQKITYYNRHNHTYQNRTGALENSVWCTRSPGGPVIRAALIAGGDTKTTKSYIVDVVFYYDEQGRLRRFVPKEPRIIRAGTPVNVDYAVFVERKGYPVLIQGIERFKPQIANLFANMLRMEKLPRLYTFKYTGKTADIYGQS